MAIAFPRWIATVIIIRIIILIFIRFQKDMFYYFEVYLKNRESPGFVSVRVS